MQTIEDRLLNARKTAVFACAAALLTSGIARSADEEGDPRNVYMAGAEVRIERAIDADLIAAAGRLDVEQAIAGDALLGAGSMVVRAPVGDDLRAAGGIVRLDSHVHGELAIAGGRIILGPTADVGGRAWLAGNNVSIAGRALSGLKVYGRNVVIRGEVYGPLDVSAERLEIANGARIYGDLTYASSNEIVVDSDAQIGGKVTRTSHTFEVPDPSVKLPFLKAIRPLLLVGLLLTGVLLYVLFPRFTARSLMTLGRSPIKSIGLGTALFFSVPPVALLLIITIIGIPVGVVLAALHAVALLTAYLITALFLADRVGRALPQRLRGHIWRGILLAGALVLMSLVISIPYLGVLIVLVALAAGLGAAMLQAYNHYTGPSRMTSAQLEL